MTELRTKLSQLKGLMQVGDWNAALRLAARFQDLGEQKERITRAWAAIQNPAFYKEIGKDPAALRAAGIEALKERYDAR